MAQYPIAPQILRLAAEQFGHPLVGFDQLAVDVDREPFERRFRQQLQPFTFLTQLQLVFTAAKRNCQQRSDEALGRIIVGAFSRQRNVLCSSLDFQPSAFIVQRDGDDTQSRECGEPCLNGLLGVSLVHGFANGVQLPLGERQCVPLAHPGYSKRSGVGCAISQRAVTQRPTGRAPTSTVTASSPAPGTLDQTRPSAPAPGQAALLSSHFSSCRAPIETRMKTVARCPSPRRDSGRVHPVPSRCRKPVPTRMVHFSKSPWVHRLVVEHWSRAS